MMQHFSFGGVESEKDYRDIPLSAVQSPVALPPTFINDISAIPVLNQKKIGACVGHAWTCAKMWMEYKETGKALPFSARFLYALAKAEDGFPGEGTYYRLGGKVLNQKGCALEGTLANDTTLSHEEYIKTSAIAQNAYEEAKPYAIKGYAAVDVSSKEAVKQAIYQNGVLPFGVRLGKEWWNDKKGNASWNASDIMPLRPPETVVSGHAIAVYGYETLPDGDLVLYFRNSWSIDWANAGNGWFKWSEYSPHFVEAWAYVDLPNGWQEHIEQPPKNAFRHTFLVNMTYKDRNDEVKALQTALKILGFFPANISETGYYGLITQMAVMKFLASKGLQESGKNAGPKTRAFLNAIFAA